MLVHEVTKLAGARKRRRRVGRGQSSGLGKTSGRGNKGCQARAGGGVRRLTEGGQMPLFRRLAKRGFNNFNFRTEYAVVNLDSLNERFADGETVGLEQLRKQRLVGNPAALVKVLGKGTLQRKLTVVAHAFSASAKAAIEQAGGKVQVIERRNPAALAKAKRSTAKVRRLAEAAAKGKAGGT